LTGIRQEIIAISLANDCQQRLSGKSQLAQGRQPNITGGISQIIHMLGTGITLVEKLTLWEKRNRTSLACMILLEMFGSGPQIGMIKTIIRIALPEIQKAHSMESTGSFEVDRLWIKQKDYVSPGVTGIYREPDLKILDFVVQKVKKEKRTNQP
jgi:hypothetical protein